MFEKIKNNKAIKIVGSILYYLLVLLVVAVLAVVLLQRVSNNNLTIGGIRIFNIVSESMVPKYQIGDVLISKSVDPTTLKIGDDIAYLGEIDTFKDKIVTHQIINIEEQDGKLIFTTKGIANASEDPKIEASQIYGKIVYHVISLSLISKIINNVFGFYFLIFMPITIIIVVKVMDIIKSRREDEEDEEDENEDEGESKSNSKKCEDESKGGKEE